MIHLFVCTVAVWAEFHFFFRFLIVFLDFSLFYLFQPVPRCRAHYSIICSCSTSGVCSFPSSSRPLAAIGKARLLRILRAATKIGMKRLLTGGIQCYPSFPIETIAATSLWRSVDSRKMEQKMAKKQRRRKLPRKSFCGGFFLLIHARKKLIILMQTNRYSPFLRVLVYCWWIAIIALVSATCQTKAECRFRCDRSKFLPLSPTTKPECSFANPSQMEEVDSRQRDQIYSDHQP